MPTAMPSLARDVPGPLDMLPEEVLRHLHLDAGAVAGLAVGAPRRRGARPPRAPRCPPRRPGGAACRRPPRRTRRRRRRVRRRGRKARRAPAFPFRAASRVRPAVPVPSRGPGRRLRGARPVLELPVDGLGGVAAVADRPDHQGGATRRCRRRPRRPAGWSRLVRQRWPSSRCPRRSLRGRASRTSPHGSSGSKPSALITRSARMRRPLPATGSGARRPAPSASPRRTRRARRPDTSPSPRNASGIERRTRRRRPPRWRRRPPAG